MNEPNQNRRDFLKTVGAVGAASILAESVASRTSLAAEGKEKLAINGGTPVRKDALHAQPYGPQFYDDVEKQELLGVLKSRSPFRGREGSKVFEFERAFAAHLGVKHVVAVTSGTTALYTAMAALEIGPGDEVILPAWTWYADYDAVILCGGLPVFVEIDESLAMDPREIEAKITPRTKAIVPSHLQGGVADLDPILEIARKHKLRVVEDCAQCCGGSYKGKHVGSIGDMGINSFQLSKTITAGEGGAVTSNDAKLFERAVRFHDVGVVRCHAEDIGGGILAAFAACNFRMNEFTGAVLKAQVKKLETICSRLRANARKVREGIADLPGLKTRKTPDPEGDLGTTVFLDHGNRERRDQFLRALRAEGIGASGPGGSVILPVDPRIENKVTVHPDWPSFNSPRGKAIRYGAECCPRTINILDRMGGVIMDPNFTDDDLKDIVRAIRKVYLAMHSA
jgi:8-amino-3,8-dideoxy-alpha-D-manno-octulosonate transaminase